MDKDKLGNLNSLEGDLKIAAVKESLPEVMAFVDRFLEESKCCMKSQMQISIAVEEIFVNIAHYAYKNHQGEAMVRIGRDDEDPGMVVLTFMDKGVPYNPLAKKDPDVTLPAEKRPIGGLGIFMTKKFMDEVTYEYRDGKNILTMKKKI